MPEVILTDQTFASEVINSPVPVLVDFWAPWCGPCRIQSPTIEELAREVDSTKYKVAKLNVDANPVTTQQFSILSIPTLVIFKNGKVIQRFVGVQNKDKLLQALNKLV